MTAHATTARRNTAQAARVQTATVRPKRRHAGTRQPAATGRRAGRGAPRAPAVDWPSRVVLAMLFLAAVAMLSLPQARGASETFGWLPLWLPGLPAMAWLALACTRRGGA